MTSLLRAAGIGSIAILLMAAISLAGSPAASEPRPPDEFERLLARDDSVMAARRHAIARALNSYEPALGKALDRPAPLKGDTAIVFASLRRAGLNQTTEDDRDMLRLGSHEWILWLLWDGESADMAHALNDVLRPLGVKLVGQDSVWEFQGRDLTTPLLVEPWRNQWREWVFLGWMDNLCEYVGNGTEWKEILERGALFLRHRPNSVRAPEVMLHMAEAHETFWSVAVSDSTGSYSAVGISLKDAPEHKRKAIELYERYLKLRPKAADRAEIRRRLGLMRAGENTEFWKYCCPNEC